MKPLLLCLLVLALPVPVLAAERAGQTPPAPTAAGQTLITGVTAPFSWQLGTLPYSTTGSAGDLTTTFPGPVVVSPTAASENGVTMTMPSGATGNAVVIKNTGTALDNKITTTGTALVLEETGDTYGTVRLHLQNRFNGNGPVFEGLGLGLMDFGFNAAGTVRTIRMEARGGAPATGTPEFEIGGSSQGAATSTMNIGDGAVIFNKPVIARTSALPVLILQIASGQTKPYLLGQTSTAAQAWQIDQNANAQFSGYSILSGGTTTPGLTVTVPLAKLTTGGTNGSETFTGGILTAYTAPN